MGEGYAAEEYVDYFMKELSEFTKGQGYTKTNLYDPSGFSYQADTHLDDIKNVTIKLLDYDFVKECMGQSISY